MKYKCFEIATDSSYHVGVYKTEEERDLEFAKLYEFLENVDTHAIGDCEAFNLEAATDMIRAGQWSYSMKC